MRRVFKASAGTGKTYSISLEYIAALLRGSKFSEILVMTFTKKATAEIRDRVLKFLESITRGYFSKDEKEHKDAKDLLKYIEVEYNMEIDDSMIKELSDTYREIISNKDKLEIHTIDGFINKLFGKIVATRENILSYELDEGNEIIEKVLEKIVSNKGYFEKFEEYFKEERKRDIEDYSKLIWTLIRNRWKYYLTGMHKPKENLAGEDSFFALEEFVEEIKKFAEMSNKDVEKVFAARFKGYISIENIEEKKNWIEENTMSLINENIWNGNQVKGKKNEAYKEFFSEKMECIWEMLAKDIYNKKIIPFENLYFSISEIVYKIYDELRFSERKFSFDDLSYYTLVAMLDKGYVRDKALTEEFYMAYGSTFKTVFLDEFQDTSILQWKILHALVNSSKDSVIVGDEKQSIYGWRDGEKRLFENLHEIIDADVKILETCYRSHSEIINFVNEYFKLVPEWEYEDVKSIKNDGYVEMNIDRYSDDSPLKLAQRILKEEKYGDCGVLARTNNQLLEVANELEKIGVPYVLENKETIYEYEACQPIYNLLKYIAYNDYFSLIKFLRSKVMNINGTDFKTLLSMREDILNYIDGGEIINIDGKLLEVLDVLGDLRKEKYYKNLGKKIIESFPFSEVFQSESERKNIIYFLSLMNNFESIVEFLLWVEDNKNSESLKRVRTQENNGVKLMTIHQSKGLEFGTEFFYWVVNSKKPNPSGIQYYLNLSRDYEKVEDYLVCDVKYRGILENLGINFDVEQRKKETDEEINNLYVALTRAEKNLICYYMDNSPNTDKFSDERTSTDPGPVDEALIRYIPNDSLRECMDSPIVSGEYIKTFQEQTTQNFESNSELENIFSVEDKVVFQKPMEFKNEYKRKDGLTLHYFMEFIYHGNSHEIEYAKKQVYQKYSNMIGSRTEELIERAIKFVKGQLLKKDNLDGLLNERWEVFNEFEITNGKSTKRIDRLMVDRDLKEAVIIDYKDSEDPEGKEIYLKQLNSYVDLIEKHLIGYKVSGKLLEID
jgi:ATP-dependent exoDNAse (exonuclease V) beta subunit